jgi:oxygen-independent coproporphyrinogen-3 oxidase
LAIEEGTELYRRYVHEDTPFNDEDVEAARMEIAERVLSETGYARYEVASYAKPHKRCSHNISYWTGVPYLGLGTAASSMMGVVQYDLMRELCPQMPKAPKGTSRVRLTITSSPHQIVSDASPSSLTFDLEYLTEQQAWAEDLMLAMRLTDGISRSRFERCEDTLEDLLGRGLVEEVGDTIRPTHQGWLLGNELYGPIWDLAEGQVLEASC